MTLQTWPVRLLSLISIVVPVMAQEAFVATPATPGASLAPPTTTILPTYNLIPSRDPVPGRALYRWSVVSLLAANGADVATSWRNQEANPFVAGPTNRFGMTSVAIKSGLVGASLLMQHFALRHRPDLAKRLAWMNFVSSGALGGVAAHNASVR